MAPYLLGIDLGTTTCRCAIFDLAGQEVASAYREMPVSYPRPLWAEIAPAAWWRGAVAVIREVLAKSEIGPAQIAGLGLSGLMHAPVLLDGQGQPVGPAMLWMDQRCAPQGEAMNREQAALGLAEGGRPSFSTTLTGPKLRWLAEVQPDILARARHLLLPKDFIRYRLTGQLGSDPSDAGGTGLFDRDKQVWDGQKVALARVPAALLPEIWPSTAAVGSLTAEAAQETGLAPETVVAVGGSDTLCTRMGIGPLAGREVCIYLGTAAWIALIDGVGADGRPLMGSFGATATTGAALRWLRDLFQDQGNGAAAISYDGLTEQAATIAPGAEGLFFLPHLMGERGPQPDPLARGGLIGLTLRHGQAHLARATLEGTAFHLRRLLEARISSHWPADDPTAGGPSTGGPIRGAACGGVARSPFWMQLLADVTGLTLRVPAVVEAGVLGAAMLGGMAVGLLSPDGAVAQMVRPGRIYEPVADLAAQYEGLYARYCRLDDLLGPWFRDA